MKRMIKYPSIEQFRTVIRNISDRACYVGKDEEGKPVFDYLKPKPTLIFTASEKVHGTNAGVCYSTPTGIWAQSRENIITTEKDNAGFVFWVSQNEVYIIHIIEKLANEYNIDLNKNIISLYGEWAGGSIQKNSAMSGLEKAFIIFEHFRVSPIETTEDKKSIWYKTRYEGDIIERDSEQPIDRRYFWACNPFKPRIYNIMNFPTYSFTIDFNSPERSINEMVSLVEETIEPASPLGKVFDKEDNIGEGIVCSYLTPDGDLIQFNVKGEKHSNSTVKTLKNVDTEKMDKLDQCANDICHSWRFEQGLVEVFGSEYDKNISRSKMGDYLKWVAKDTLKEELDIIANYGIEPKEIMSRVQERAKKYFYETENKG